MPENIQQKQYTNSTLPKGVCDRADLLRALVMAECDVDRENALAFVLGFVPIPVSEGEIIIDEEQPTTIPESVNTGTGSAPLQSKPKFRPYYLTRVDTETTSEAWQEKSPDDSESGTLTIDDQKSWRQGYPAPEVLPIVPWPRLWPRLRAAVAQTRAASLDIPRLSEQISRGLIVRQLPRKVRLSWPSPLPVVLDFSDRLTAYWDDWHWLRRELQARFNQQIRFYRLYGVPQRDLQPLRNGKPEPHAVSWPKLGSGDTLLLVSDLGMVDPAHPWPAACWQEKLADYRRQGVRVIVLAPASVRHLRPALVNVAEVVRLSPDSDLRPVRRMPSMCVSTTELKYDLLPAGQTLLAMMSVATRVEPALLRALRHCLPDHSADVGLEAEVWCYPEMDTAATACALTQWAVQKWRQKFAELSETLQQRTLDCLRDWHAKLPQAIHHEETILWRHLAKPSIAGQEEYNVQKARDFFNRLKNSLTQKKGFSQQGSQALLTQFADRHVHWVASTLSKKESYVESLSVAVMQAESDRAQAGLPVGVDPMTWLKSLPDITSQRVNLLQSPDLSLAIENASQSLNMGYTRLATMDLDREALLWAWVHGDELSVYRPWHLLENDRVNAPVLPGLLEIDAEQQPSANLYLHTGRHHLKFEPFNPPTWATAWGQDAYGFYVDLNLQNIIQRFRWIEPGIFSMGSPETEVERRDNEFLHQVTISKGFWLADTVCTQVLWQVIMGDNPAHFNDNNNKPVERVSWDDVQVFIKNLNDHVENLAARLPTEAEWEYACRAGTETPFSFGSNITTEQVNYDGNYPYAGGKKDIFRGETLAVKSLPANAWGLYEMHGNVWEWCHDWYEEYPKNNISDPQGPPSGAGRIIRGGSWRGSGRDVRSAIRSGFGPDYRDFNLGFRLALGHTDLRQGRKGREQHGQTLRDEAADHDERQTAKNKTLFSRLKNTFKKK